MVLTEESWHVRELPCQDAGSDIVDGCIITIHWRKDQAVRSDAALDCCRVDLPQARNILAPKIC
jgi:hypothetical protein